MKTKLNNLERLDKGEAPKLAAFLEVREAIIKDREGS